MDEPENISEIFIRIENSIFDFWRWRQLSLKFHLEYNNRWKIYAYH